MEVSYHPLVKRDFAEALRFYDEISRRLADEFAMEVRSIIDQATANPPRFHVAGHELRRANLRRFPHHILYEIQDETLRVMHVRHNKRNPDYGMPRS